MIVLDLQFRLLIYVVARDSVGKILLKIESSFLHTL